MREFANTSMMIAAVAAALVLSACGRGQTTYIGQQAYVPYYERLDPQNVELFVGTVEREHEAIAWVDSPAVIEQTPEEAQKQLLALQEAASKAGAHAVHEIRTETIRAKNFVTDERVPFYAWKQGYYEMKILRGVAIRFTDEEAARSANKPIEVVRRSYTTDQQLQLDDPRIPPYSGPEF